MNIQKTRPPGKVLRIILLVVVVLVTTAAVLVSAHYMIERNTMTSAQVPGGRLSSTSFQLTGAFGGMIGTASGTTQSLCIGYICKPGSEVFLPMITR